MSNLRSLFLQHLAQTSDSPLSLTIDRAHGVWLYGPDGAAWMDLISGVGLCPLGHTHPAIVQAVQEQVSRYMHVMVYGEYILSPQVQLATRLTETLPPHLDSVYLLNSGSEAVEGAMKLAKRFTGRYNIISAATAYHGSTHGAMSLMSEGFYTDAFRPLLPGVSHIQFNDTKDLERIDHHTAAVIIETIQAECGIRIPDVEWLQALRKKCTDTGALLIFDEIQCGYGRTGHLWACAGYDVWPDILVIGKGMGGGMPISAFIANRTVMQKLTHDPVLGHITTFGGHPVSSAAALATLEILLTQPVIQQVRDRSDQFVQRLSGHPRIREIRRAGLMMAIDLGDPEAVQKTIRYGLDQGIVMDWFLFNTQCLRISPALTITVEEVDMACDRLYACLDAV